MQKKLIALAIAGAFAAPAFAASSNVDVYGLIHFAIEDTNKVNSDIEVKDRVSRIGFKGSEDLGGGLKAIWQIEQQINATSPAFEKQSTAAATAAWETSNGAFGGAGLRNTFVGLSGGFGTVLMGRHDTPYKIGSGSLDIMADTIGDYNSTQGVALVDAVHDYRSPQAVAYISPNLSGFTVAVAGIATNNGPWVHSGRGDLDPGNLDNGDSFDASSATVMYSNGPLFASLGYQDVNLVDSQAWKAAVAFTFGDATIGALYEKVDNSVQNLGKAAATVYTTDRDSWLVNVKYNLGAITLKGIYGQANIDADAVSGNAKKDQKAWTVDADYNLSKRTTAYVAYSASDDGVAATKNQNGWALGLKHSF